MQLIVVRKRSLRSVAGLVGDDQVIEQELKKIVHILFHIIRMPVGKLPEYLADAEGIQFDIAYRKRGGAEAVKLLSERALLYGKMNPIVHIFPLGITVMVGEAGGNQEGIAGVGGKEGLPQIIFPMGSYDQ